MQCPFKKKKNHTAADIEIFEQTHVVLLCSYYEVENVTD